MHRGPIALHEIIRENATPQEKVQLMKMDKSDINNMNATLIQNLYASVLRRKLVDFGDIPDSNGDIEKVKYYETTVECLDILEEVSKNNSLGEIGVSDIKECLGHIKRLKPQFEQGFRMNNDMVIITFNSMTMACIDATSMLIVEYMDYVVNSSEDTMRLKGKHDKKRGAIALDSIRRFNNVTKSGSTGKSLDYILEEQRKNFAGVEVVVTGVIVMGLLSIVPIIRELIFFYYHGRVVLSDYLKLQADFLEMNKLVVESSKRSPKEKKEILKKQEAIMKKLRKSANKLSINTEDSDDVVKKELKQENKLWTLDNIDKQITKNKMEGNSFNFL